MNAEMPTSNVQAVIPNLEHTYSITHVVHRNFNDAQKFAIEKLSQYLRHTKYHESAQNCLNSRDGSKIQRVGHYDAGDEKVVVAIIEFVVD